MKPQIFLSYSHRDVEIMRQVKDSLEARDFSVWSDEFLVPGTVQWEAEIAQAIEKSKALVVILSPEAKQSLWVSRELSYADEQQVRIFPVLALGDEKSSIPFRLTTAQRVDIRDSYAQGIEQLSNALYGHLGITSAKKRASAYEKDTLLLSKAIHDLRVPHISASGYLDMFFHFYGNTVTDPTALQFLEIIQRSLKRMDSLMSDLSELSRLRRHLLPKPEMPIDINQSIEAVLADSRSLAELRNQKVFTDFQANLPLIMVDGKQIERLILNLFNNAIKYTPEGGEIYIRTFYAPQLVSFSVRDTGIGIAETFRPYLFEPFSRGVDADHSQGTGLGLAIVKEIVEAYDGNIEVESAENHGSTFTISFPVDEALNNVNARPTTH